MKRVFIWVTLLVTMIVLSNAQDVIVKRDGSTIISKVLEVNTGDIKYKKFSNQGGPTYTIDKAEVMAINYENGEKDVFNVANTANQAPSQAQNTSVPQGGGMSEASKAANNAYISSVNNFLPAWAEPQKAKKANGTFNVLKIDENSVLENDDIRMHFIMQAVDSRKKKGIAFVNEKISSYGIYGIAVKIQNKTSNTIYVDLGNTFITRGEETEPYYIPTATSTTHGSSSGVGVNMGAVAGAMGVGGTIGQLASGVNVGGGNSNSTTTIEYSQRVIAIPPQSSKSLDTKFVFTGTNTPISNYINVEDRSNKSDWWFLLKSMYKDLMVGDIVHWSTDNSPFTLQLHVSYAFDELCSNLTGIRTKFFVSETFGVRRTIGSYVVISKDVTQLNGWENTPFCFCTVNKSDDGVALSPHVNIEHTGK